MGDKSPKSKQKNQDQKDSKTTVTDRAKKREIESKKQPQVPGKKKG